MGIYQGDNNDNTFNLQGQALKGEQGTAITGMVETTPSMDHPMSILS